MLPLSAMAGWTDLPRWARRLIIVGTSAVVGLWLVGRRQRQLERESGEAELKAAAPKRQPGQRFVTLAGRGGVGKSAVGNALLGTDLFGPGAAPAETGQWQGNWFVRELPAGALLVRDVALLRQQVGADDILVLVVDEQLFRAERQFLDLVANELPEVRRLVYINKSDLLAAEYTADEAETIRAAVRASATDYVDSPDDIVWGSAAPDAPALDALRGRLADLAGG